MKIAIHDFCTFLNLPSAPDSAADPSNGGKLEQELLSSVSLPSLSPAPR